ncbi:MAG: hypothetical protein WCC17_18955 [Candidatus Nitrosopolaris sp.]
MNTYPANSGKVICYNKEYPLNIYLYVETGTKCTAQPTKGFEFSSWVQKVNNSTVTLNTTEPDSPWNSLRRLLGGNDTSAKFELNGYGIFTANFKPLPPPIPPEYVATLFGIVATAFVSTWLTPAIIGRRKTSTQRKYFRECENQIGKLDKNAIEEKVIAYYVDGKISQDHRQLLNDKISEYYEKEKTSERHGAPFA